MEQKTHIINWVHSQHERTLMEQKTHIINWVHSQHEGTLMEQKTHIIIWVHRQHEGTLMEQKTLAHVKLQGALHPEADYIRRADRQGCMHSSMCDMIRVHNYMTRVAWCETVYAIHTEGCVHCHIDNFSSA